MKTAQKILLGVVIIAVIVFIGQAFLNMTNWNTSLKAVIDGSGANTTVKTMLKGLVDGFFN